MRNWLTLTVVLIVTLFLIGGIAVQSSLLAQDEGGTADEADGKEGKELSLLDTIIAGSWIELVIILLSIAALALIIENFVTLKVENFIPQDLLIEYDELLDVQNYDEAMAISETDDCMLSRVFSAGLIKQQAGIESMEEAVNDAASAEIGRLRQKIGVLALIANIAPMLGLLGTVTGMIIAFNEIAKTESPAPSDLARGISQALITTCTGLIVAIPVSAAYYFLRNRVSRIANELSIVAGDFLDRFRVEA